MCVRNLHPPTAANEILQGATIRSVQGQQLHVQINSMAPRNPPAGVPTTLGVSWG
jgi:hypothetical protein